jgi:FdhD protein
MTKLPGDDRKGGGEPTVLRYDGRRLVPVVHTPMPELSVVLSVNGAPFATLIASPHDLHYLVAGFLRLQGVVRTPADLLSLTVSERQGSVSGRGRGEVPERPSPVPLRGLGGEIDLPRPEAFPPDVRLPGAGPFFRPESVIGTMGLLARSEEGCRETGMHRAAAGDGERLLLFAEDIGRHNAVDRIAGEALLKGIDLSGRILATSGRVSSGMAAKAAILGVFTVVSRSTPTDPAIGSAGSSGSPSSACVRGERFNVYSQPRPDLAAGPAGRIAGSPARSFRRPVQPHGCDKRCCRTGAAGHRGDPPEDGGAVREVIVVGSEPGQYDFMPCRLVPDLFPGMGALAGILQPSSTATPTGSSCRLRHAARQGELSVPVRIRGRGGRGRAGGGKAGWFRCTPCTAERAAGHRAGAPGRRRELCSSTSGLRSVASGGPRWSRRSRPVLLPQHQHPGGYLPVPPGRRVPPGLSPGLPEKRSRRRAGWKAARSRWRSR